MQKIVEVEKFEFENELEKSRPSTYGMSILGRKIKVLNISIEASKKRSSLLIMLYFLVLPDLASTMAD